MNDISTEITASSGMENCVYDLTSLAEGASLCGPWCPTSGVTHWVHIEYKRFWRFSGVQLNITKTNVWDKITGATAEVFIATTSHQVEVLDTQYPDNNTVGHDDVIKWKHFPRNWPFVRGIHRSPVNSPHKGQWRGALMFSLIRVWINDWVNNGEAGDLRRYRAHCDVIVMWRASLSVGMGK